MSGFKLLRADSFRPYCRMTESSITRLLAASPVFFLTRGFKCSNDVPVQRPHHANTRKHCRPSMRHHQHQGFDCRLPFRMVMDVFAGKFGHVPFKRGPSGRANRPVGWARHNSPPRFRRWSANGPDSLPYPTGPPRSCRAARFVLAWPPSPTTPRNSSTSRIDTPKRHNATKRNMIAGGAA
jgi:hypothetical protein